MGKMLNFFDGVLTRGRRLQEAGRDRDAVQLYESLAANAGTPADVAVEARLRAGHAHLEQGQPETAQRLLAEACKRDPYAAQCHYLHALACAAGVDPDLAQASQSLQQAIELDPDEAAFRIELGKIQIELGQVEDGLQSLRTAVEMRPAEAATLRELVDVLMDLGDEEEAASAIRVALFRNPRIQGFRQLWSDFRFCQVLGDTPCSPTSAKEPQSPRVLRFEPSPARKTPRAHRERRNRNDVATIPLSGQSVRPEANKDLKHG